MRSTVTLLALVILFGAGTAVAQKTPSPIQSRLGAKSMARYR